MSTVTEWLPRPRAPLPLFLFKGVLSQRATLGLALGGLFFVGALLLTFRSLSYPLYWDDVHLVRTFSPGEIVQAFTGSWDVDGVETPGYRPGTVLFNGARAALFGENVVAQRLLILGLFAASLSLLALLAVELGMRPWQAAFGGLLALASKDNWWNLVWVSDGSRVLACLLILASAYLVVSGILRRARWKLPTSVVLAALALLTREEPLALLPLVPVFGLTALLVKHGSPARMLHASGMRRDAYTLVGLSVALASLGVLLLLARFFLTATARAAMRSQAMTPLAWPRDVFLVLYPMGLTRFATVVKDPVHVVWALMLLGLVFGAVRLIPRPAAYRALLWLGCAVVTCAPAVMVGSARPNILLLPISFVGLAVAELIGGLVLYPRNAARVSGVVIGLFITIVAADQSLVAQDNQHPQSLSRLQNDEMMIYGLYGGKTTIPSEREIAVRAELANFGVYSHQDYQRIMPVLWDEAERAGRHAPNPQEQPFVPEIGFMVP